MKTERRLFLAGAVAALVSLQAAGDVPAAASYVSSGLVNHYDALENAGAGVHDNAATSWAELTGKGSAGTLYTAGVTWEDKALVSARNGKTNKPVRLGTGPSELIAGRVYSVEVVFTPNCTGARQVFFGSYAGTSLRGLSLEIFDSPANSLRVYFGGSPDIKTSSILTDGTGTTVSLTTDGQTHGIYRDGTAVTVSTTPNTGSMPTTVDTVLGGEPNTGRDFSLLGRIHACRIYDRVLTADEVKLNAALDQVRYFGADPATVSLPDGYLFNGRTNLVTVLSVKTADANRGSVRIGEGSAVCVTNDVTLATPIAVTATPAEGYRFDHWVGLPATLVSGGRETAALSVTGALPAALTAVFVSASRPTRPAAAACVEADGQSAVDTRYYHNGNSAFVADYAWVGTPESQDGIFGTRIGDAWVHLYVNHNDGDQSWTFCNGNGKYNATGVMPDANRHLAALDMYNQTVTLKTGAVTDYSATGIAKASNTATYPVALFASPSEDAETKFKFLSAARLYSFEIRESDALCAFYAPYASADGVGFMDVVTGAIRLNEMAGGTLALTDGYGTAEDYFVEKGVLYARLYAHVFQQGSGTVSVGGAALSADAVWIAAGPAALVATPAKGYRFVRWEGDTAFFTEGSATDASVTLDASRVRSLTAVFERVGSYVQDGLVVWYDGIENAGIGTHSDSPAVWKDLTTNGVDGALMDGLAWTDNAWRYTDTTTAVSKKPVNAGTVPSAVISGTRRFTVEFACRPGRDGVRQTFASQYDGGDGFAVEHRKDKGLRAYFNGAPDFAASDLKVAKDENATVALTTDASTHVFYTNGVRGAVNETANTGTMVVTDFVVGGEPNVKRDMSFRGDFFGFRFYNRPLTADEALLNAAVDKVRFFGMDPADVALPAGCVFDADNNVVFAERAVWTGAADRSLSNPANWSCTDVFGRELAGVCPNGFSEVVLSGDVNFDIPEGSSLSFKKFTVGTIRLTADCDWRGLGAFDLPEGAFVDLNGHALHYQTRTGETPYAAEVTDTAGGGELHLYGTAVSSSSGPHYQNTRIAFTGKMRLVWNGPGYMDALRTGQTYGGGTVIDGGTVWIASKSKSPATYLQFGRAGSEIVIAQSGSVAGYLNLRGNLGFNVYPIVLDGGFLYNGTSQSASDNGVGDIRLTADSTIAVYANTSCGTPSSSIDCAGHTLTVDVDSSSDTLYLRTPAISNGTVSVLSSAGRVSVAGCDKDYRTARLIVRSNLTVAEGVTIDAGDFTCALPSDDDTGAGLVRVHGAFKPTDQRFHDTELADGATLDLSDWSTVFAVESSLTPSACAQKKLSFAANGRIEIDLGERTFAAGDPVVSWTEAPANLDTVRFVFADSDTMPYVTSTGILYGGVPAAEVATAVWKGGTSTDLSAAANWTCTDFNGAEVAGGVPGRYATVRFAGSVAFGVPAGVLWWKMAFGSVALAADCDWTAYGPFALNEGAAIDLNGHDLALVGAPGETPYAAAVANGAGTAATLSLGIPAGTELNNTRVTIADGVTLAVTGPGTYRAGDVTLTRRADGTLVKGGTGTYVIPAGSVPAAVDVTEGTLSFAETSVTTLVHVATGATVALADGGTLACSSLSGAGTVRGGALVLDGLVFPGGDGTVGTLHLDSAVLLTGRLSVEVGDRIELGSPIRAEGAQLVVTDLQDLTGSEPYVVVSGAVVYGARQMETNLDGTGWKLLRKSSVLSIAPSETPELGGAMILFN